MTEKDLFEKWMMIGTADHDKSLYIEYVYLCNFISDEDFYSYLHPNEASEAQFLSVLDFLHHQRCYMLLYRFMNDNKDRLIFPEFNQLEGIILRKDIEERLRRCGFRYFLT